MSRLRRGSARDEHPAACCKPPIAAEPGRQVTVEDSSRLPGAGRGSCAPPGGTHHGRCGAKPAGGAAAGGRRGCRGTARRAKIGLRAAPGALRRGWHAAWAAQSVPETPPAAMRPASMPATPTKADHGRQPDHHHHHHEVARPNRAEVPRFEPPGTPRPSRSAERPAERAVADLPWPTRS